MGARAMSLEEFSNSMKSLTQRGGYYQGRGAAPQPRGGMVLQQQQQQPRGPAGWYPGPRQAHGRMQLQQYHSGGRGGRGASPSSPSAPELRQAMEVQLEPAQTPSLQTGSSEPEPSPQALDLEVAEQLKEVSVKGEASTNQEIVRAIPASSKSIRFPLRPGKGNIGTRCLVKANHFFAELPDKDLHRCDIVSRAVMKELVNLYKASYLGGRLPAYDGRKSLYTAGPLPFTSKNFKSLYLPKTMVLVLRDKEETASSASMPASPNENN